jgi:hypothetical protein
MTTCPKFTGIPEDFTERVSLVYEGGTRNVKKKQGVEETTVPDSQAGLHRSRFALACSLFVACLLSVSSVLISGAILLFPDSPDLGCSPRLRASVVGSGFPISVIGLDQWCDF